MSMFDLDVDMKHKDGIEWFDAPLPPRLHKCFAQTEGWIGFDQVLRCACGAMRNPRFGKTWMDVNSRRGAVGKQSGGPSSALMIIMWIIAVALIFAGCFTKDMALFFLLEGAGLAVLFGTLIILRKGLQTI